MTPARILTPCLPVRCLRPPSILQGGSLQQQVYKVMAQPHSAIYSHIDALTWASDIAAAVAHLHSLNPVIIHRDLKLENILLLKPSAQGPGGGPGSRKLPVAKLTDFGLHVVSTCLELVSTKNCCYGGCLWWLR